MRKLGVVSAICGTAYATVLLFNFAAYKSVENSLLKINNRLWRNGDVTLAEEFSHHVIEPFRENKISALNPAYVIKLLEEYNGVEYKSDKELMEMAKQK